MEKQGEPSEKMPPPLWQYVPIEDYKSPQGMVSESLRGGIAGLWQRLRSSRQKPDTAFEPEKKLQVLSEALLKKNVPPPDWQTAVPALYNALLPWINASGLNPVALVVGLQRSGNGDVLRLLAKEKNGIPLLRPR